MTKLTRRRLLQGTAATAIGISLPMPFISKTLAASGKITVGMEAGSPYDTFYRAKAPEFTAASGVEVEFQSIPHDNIRQQFVLDSMSGAGGFDVYIADQVWLPEFFEKGFIRDLSGLYSDADKADFSKTAIETVTHQGAQVALPIMVHNCAMYYRKDLLEAAGISGPPTTWDEYRAAAKATTSGDVFGTMICSKQGIEAATRLHSFYQQAGGDLLDADGKPTINSDAGRAALEFMTALVFEDKSAPEGVLELPDMQGRWLEGKLALAPVWPYLYSLSKEPLGDTFGITTSPGLTNPGGTVYSWGFAGAAGAKNIEGADEFLKWATSTDLLYAFGKEWLNPVPRASAIDLIGADTAISDADKAAIAGFAASAAAGKSMTMVPQYSQLLDILGIMQSGVPRIAGSGEFQMALWQTLGLVAAAFVLETVIGLAVALALHRGLRGSRVFSAIIALPLMVAPVVGALAWRFIFGDGYGMIDSLLGLFGVNGPLWFADVWLARATIVIANLWMALPFDILVLLAGLASLPTDPIEAAQVDGASPTQILFTVMLPLLRPVIAVILVVRFADAFRIFDVVYILTGSGPANSTDVLSTYIYRQMFTVFDFPGGAAAAVLLVLITATFSLLAVLLLRDQAREG